MKSVTAHLTFFGTPVCQHQVPGSIVFGLCCEYDSLAEARRVASNIRHFSKSVATRIPERHYALKVVRGACPAFGEV